MDKVIKLGDHRLICGDSTDHEFVAEFLAGEKIRAVVTDPPYGVDYVANKKNFFEKGGSKINVDRDIEGDDLIGGAYYDFSIKWLSPIREFLTEKNQFYIFNGDTNLKELMEALEKLGYKRSQLIIWIKNMIVKGRKDYNPQHELIVYGWYGKHKFERRQGRSVIFYPRPQKSLLHPTMKPIGLLRKLILNSTKINETVFDPFGGSGSTLIACEHTKRKCLMVEKDPEYCQIIIERFKKLNS